MVQRWCGTPTQGRCNDAALVWNPAKRFEHCDRSDWGWAAGEAAVCCCGTNVRRLSNDGSFPLYEQDKQPVSKSARDSTSVSLW
jgi:hypothetical protein